MKKEDRYTYPAVFTYEPGCEIAVEFPDLGVATSGVNDDDALLSARELLGCVLYGLEEDGEEIPAPSLLSRVAVDGSAHTALVDVYMPSIRQAQSTKAVNRTVTLPAWLNALAVEHGVNFSQTLQAALRDQLAAK
ncbi:MAG: type II toxin-antitoxin system HicB family antitoxin [Gordonibacter sp.]|uniref:type II toxin-antitoxin system HicB family antitoxin n=1 Tax=Gordonibacter sp. TaxID=1968902 RepID=UPI002FC73223